MAPSVIKDAKIQLKGHSNWCRDAVWSPDGDMIGTACADNFLRVFQCDGTEAWKHKHDDWVWSCDFSFTPKRKRLVSACLDGKIRVFDAALGRKLLEIQAHEKDKTVNSVALSPHGGEFVLSGSYDKTARIHTVGNGKQVLCIDCFTGPVLSVLWTIDGTHAIAASSTGQLVVADARTGSTVQRNDRAHSGKVNGMAVSPDGKLLVTAGADKCSKVWFLGDEGAQGQCSLIATLKVADEAAAAAFSPDQLLLAVACADGIVRVFHATDGWPEVARIKGHSDEVNAVSFTAKGARTLLATASDDRNASIFDLSPISVQLKVAAAKAGKAAAAVSGAPSAGLVPQEPSVGDPADMDGLD